MVTQQLQQRGHYDRARMLNDLLERKRLSALAQLRKALKATSYEDRSKMLRFAKAGESQLDDGITVTLRYLYICLSISIIFVYIYICICISYKA